MTLPSSSTIPRRLLPLLIEEVLCYVRSIFRMLSKCPLPRLSFPSRADKLLPLDPERFPRYYRSSHCVLLNFALWNVVAVRLAWDMGPNEPRINPDPSIPGAVLMSWWRQLLFDNTFHLGTGVVFSEFMLYNLEMENDERVVDIKVRGIHSVPFS